MPDPKLTKEEKAAIASLERVAAKWPQSLWLYSASGTLNVMKKSQGIKRVMFALPHGGVAPGMSVAQIEIENDGGDW